MIALGVLFLLSRLEVADFGQLVRRYWPMIVVLVGLPKLAARDTVWSGLWLITVGIWLQMAHLKIFDLTYGSSWPLLLIALGAGMIVRAVVESLLRPREGVDER
ncbi:MAG TPA: DUF5668 domain-containing protein, partial [Thermoanaerobaculia bacterium]|nr:DUF5668 domain-containing protein [Thermoanaerobaculia bacterium]